MLHAVRRRRTAVAALSLMAAVGGCAAIQAATYPRTNSPTEVDERIPADWDGQEKDPQDSLGGANEALIAKAGTTATWRCPIDGPQRLYGTFLMSGETAHFELTNGAGVHLDQLQRSEDYVTPSIKLIECEIDSSAGSDIFVNLVAGEQSAKLDATLRFGNKVSLVADVQPIAVSKPNGCITIRAKLTDSGGGALIGEGREWYCLVVSPKQEVSRIVLYNDGLHSDGDPGDEWWGAVACGAHTKEEGHYALKIRGRSVVSQREVLRDVVTGFIVQSTGATFCQKPIVTLSDADGDGLTDSIDLACRIEVLEAGRYRILARFRDNAGKCIEILRGDTGEVPPSTLSVTLSVAGEKVVRHGLSGPWVMSDIELFSERNGPVVAAVADSVVVESRNLELFERPPAPSIARVTPGSGPMNGGNEVLFAGEGFLGTTRVLFGALPVPFELRDDSTIAVTAPRRVDGAGAVVSVTVVTKWGTATKADAYTYQ